MIGHYADGARLIGLSEQQIRRHLDRLRESSSDNKSPYAQPPYLLTTPARNKPCIPKLDTIGEDRSATYSTQSDDLKLTDNMLIPKGRIRLKFVVVRPNMKEENTKGEKSAPTHIEQKRIDLINHMTKRKSTKYHGWIAQRTTTTKVALPLLSVKDLIQKQIKQERKISNEIKKREMLNFNDMEVLRKKVQSLAKVYYERVNCKRRDEALQHWDNLAVGEIPSRNMQNIYQRAFKAYADYSTTPISSLCFRSLA